MAGGVEELLSMLYNMVQEAWSVPLGADKCILQREKVLDLIDEINAALPADLKQARTIVEARNEVIASAKREADAIRLQAEEKARRLVSEETVLLEAKRRAGDIITSAESKSADIRKVTNDYVEDSFKRVTDALSAALEEVRQSRSQFRSAVGKGGAGTEKNSK
jgi:cell division septum initiation protein DivIVA